MWPHMPLSCCQLLWLNELWSLETKNRQIFLSKSSFDDFLTMQLTMTVTQCLILRADFVCWTNVPTTTNTSPRIMRRVGQILVQRLSLCRSLPTVFPSVTWNVRRAMVKKDFHIIYKNYQLRCLISASVQNAHGPRARYVKMRVAHAPGMSGTFSPPLRVSNPDMHEAIEIVCLLKLHTLDISQ